MQKRVPKYFSLLQFCFIISLLATYFVTDCRWLPQILQNTNNDANYCGRKENMEQRKLNI